MNQRVLLLMLSFVWLVLSCDKNESIQDLDVVSDPDYVGRESCKACHELQYELFVGSDHDMAMDIATEQTVLGDFNNHVFEHLGVTSNFYKRNGQFFVRTEGPDGEMEEFAIRYTFGIRPLQQYVVEFPDGAYQMLPICWDTRPVEQGGQRWFHIYGEERIEPNDLLYWTRMAQNWNYMCSECHSTRVRKNYDRFSETYNTTWSEIDVSCEACHGPCFEHVAWAQAADQGVQKQVEGYLGLTIRLKDTDQATWVFADPQSPTAERTVPLQNRKLVAMCSRCHSRRTIIHEDYTHGGSLLQTHRPALLEEGLYFPDGQILDEVYVYGSFLQSKMFTAGVTCKDCHEPHSGATYVQGNALCYRCHAPAHYGVRDHHFHDSEQSGGLCVECHMAERTYMVVDPRRDHSMRNPRPDLSDRLETPNACIKCHDDKTNAWAVDYTRQWYGELESGKTHYGEIFYAGRRRYAEANDDLVQLADDESQAPMIRATALHLLGGYPSRNSAEVLKNAVNAEDPLLRATAVNSSVILEGQDRYSLLKHLLEDSVRLVRVQTAHALADIPEKMWKDGEKQQFQEALQEYKETQYINADHETAHLNLAILATHQGDYETAEAHYRKAIEIEPLFVYSYINLADLYRMQDREDDGEQVLQEALRLNPGFADIHHALGLLYVRRKNLDKALDHVRIAAELEPQNARFSYVYAVALNSTGESEGALQVLQETLQRHPYDRDVLLFLATLNRDLGRMEQAILYASRLVQYYPDVVGFQHLEEELKAQSHNE